MRTYSHVILTYATLRLAKSPKRAAPVAALGAALPDLPAGLGAAWLWTEKRTATREDFDREVCGRSVFRVPDAASHSLPALLLAFPALKRFHLGRMFVLGWLGHILSDFLTHSSDARAHLWPLSGQRFRSPVSYHEKDRYGRVVTVIEHLTLMAVLIRLFKGSKKHGSTAGEGLRK